MFVGAALKAPTSLNWPLIEVPLKIHFIFPPTDSAGHQSVAKHSLPQMDT